MDFGLLDLWNHEATPSISGFSQFASIREVANSAPDYRIGGPDAIAAGRAFSAGPATGAVTNVCVGIAEDN